MRKGSELSEFPPALHSLLEKLFPRLAYAEIEHDSLSPIAICWRRSLLTVLRYGLPPGHYSSRNIDEFLQSPFGKQKELLEQAIRGESTADFLDRLEERFWSTNFDHLTFWQSVSDVIRKPREWQSELSIMQEVSLTFGRMFERQYLSKRNFPQEARRYFNLLCDAGDMEIVPHILRSHFFALGLFGRSQRTNRRRFLDADETKNLALTLGDCWRGQHLSGALFNSIWHPDAVFALVETDLWDEECKGALKGILKQDDPMDAFALLFFGGNWTTDRSTIDTLVGQKYFERRLRERIETAKGVVHQTVLDALSKAHEGLRD